MPEYPVTLVHPDGEREFIALTPGDYNQLVYGAGYTPKEQSVTEVAPSPAPKQQAPKPSSEAQPPVA